MKEIHTYPTATAFRRALEDRLKTLSRNEKVDLQRLRKEVAFDRFLARLFHSNRPPWVLKGGYAMELRIKEARATRDIDLTLWKSLPKDKRPSQNLAILEALRQAAQNDLGDFFTFLVGEPMQDLDAAPYGGARYPVEAQMEGRGFISFHLDVGVGDVVLEPLDLTEGREWLAFAGIKGHRFPTISKEQQFAEKIHAYTLPRTRTNTRVRDLVDMVLLLRMENMLRKETVEAVKAVFARRKTHAVPPVLIAPPSAWAGPYAVLAKECGLTESLVEAFQEIARHFSKVIVSSGYEHQRSQNKEE